MVKSMTGFATIRGEALGFCWVWEARSVNARGLDIRLRLPDWIDGLDQAVRGVLGKAVARGNVSASLKLVRDAAGGAERLDEDALARALTQMAGIDAAAAAGLTLARPSAADILGLRGVLTSESPDEDTAPLLAALTVDLPELTTAFDAMRQAEGRALGQVITGQLDRIAALTAEAADLAEARKDQTAARLRENLARVLDNAEGADEARVAQELAMIAVKTDVTEEIDRLQAHVQAARDLLASRDAVGRKLDFLAQEFNREANTLCSKSQSPDLTRVGLDLKATIDQMREQVQNVE
ncbi:MAG: YicC family protein [Rhodobacteraceae bacterium]|nr:YicC family protein [Paracoccaceae bacterium]